MRKQKSNAGLTFYFTVIKRHSTSNLNLRPIHNFLTQLCINFQKYDFFKNNYGILVVYKLLAYYKFCYPLRILSYRMKWKLPQRSLEAHSP